MGRKCWWIAEIGSGDYTTGCGERVHCGYEPPERCSCGRLVRLPTHVPKPRKFEDVTAVVRGGWKQWEPPRDHIGDTNKKAGHDRP